MKNSKKAWIVFRRILTILFIIYLINYFMASTGYYEKQINNKTVLTEEKIREFESDVRNGEEVDIKNYIDSDKVDNSNGLSKTGRKVSNTINDFVTNKAIKIFKFFGKLFS